ncbi:uncharacterized protein LOC107370644 [Tetranychus urticae]|uniref:uncharacterized protein LOC107370644 n=1 Tax=Tetranychus urticae TaxID=32264 RepID=UPI00077C05FF|nr:uncharacterized protein LOC107370644 [Tetranychus urticae]
MAPKKNKQFYAYYFSTKDGPENRNKKYHIDSLEDISLYDGDQPLKLARIQVRNKPWTVKSDDPNERWPDLLVDISHDKKKLTKIFAIAPEESMFIHKVSVR